MTRPGGAARTLLSDLRGGAGPAQALRGFVDNMGGVSGAARGASKDLGVLLKSITQVSGGAARSVGGLLSGVGSMLGWGGVAVGAGMGLYEWIHHGSQQHAQLQNAFGVGDNIYSTLNKYNDALGLAGSATTTLADAMNSAANKITSSAERPSQSRTVTSAELESWGLPTSRKPTIWYNRANSPQEQAAVIGSMNLRGLSSSQRIAVMRDLYYSGIPVAQINQTMGMVPNAGRGGLGLSAQQGQQLAYAINNFSGAGNESGWGINAQKRWLTGTNNSYSQRSWEQFGHWGGGNPVLTRPGLGILHQAMGTIGQAAANAAPYGRGYAAQSAIRAANNLLQGALQTRNADTVVAIEQAITANLTGTKSGITGLSPADIQRQGLLGILGRYAGQGHTVLGMNFSQLQSQGLSLTGRGIRRTPQPELNLVTLPGGSRSVFAPFYGNQGGGVAGRATRTALAQPENVAAVTTAAMSIVSTMVNNGTSLRKITDAATRSLATATPQQATLQTAVIQEAQQRLGFAQIGMAQPQQLASQLNAGLGLMNTNINNPQAAQLRQQGIQQAQQATQGITQMYQQRLMAQYQYQIQSERSQEDFQRQQARSREDFARETTREIQDYYIQLHRTEQTQAQQDYNPYQRIQVQQVWDATSLLGNIQQQNTALRQQVQDIDRLRQMGLSEAAIQQLDLYNPSNAQQVAYLTQDLQSSRGLIGQYNQAARTRQRMATALYTQTPQYKQSREDFNRELARQQQDFNTQNERAQQDFATQMQRMAQDLHTQDLSITGNMQQLQTDMIHILHGQAIDWKSSLESTIATTLRLTRRGVNQVSAAMQHSTSNFSSHQDFGSTASSYPVTGGLSGGGTAWGSGPRKSTTGHGHYVPGQGYVQARGVAYTKPGTGKVYDNRQEGDPRPSAEFMKAHPPNVAFNRSIARSMIPAFGWKDVDRQMAALDWIWGQHESGWNQYAYNPTDPNHYGQDAYGIPQAYPGRKMAGAGGDWVTNPATQIKWGLGYIKSTYGSPIGAQQQYVVGGGYAQGGIAMQPQIAAIAEAGNPEAMIPLNERGANFFARAIGKFLSPAQAAMITTGGMARSTYISDNSQHYYDHRTVIAGGNYRVEANDPATMARSIREKERRDNFTNPRGVAWRPST